MPQSMPAGDDVTVPAPVPVRVTVSVCKIGLKVAVTVLVPAMASRAITKRAKSAKVMTSLQNEKISPLMLP